MYETRQLTRICNHLNELVVDELERVGLFYRIFYRVKSPISTNNKIDSKAYDGVDSYLRDLIGIRIILYFPDDIDHVYAHLKRMFTSVKETVDQKEVTIFEPNRINLTFRIPANFQKEFRDHVPDRRIDTTFEVQLRTILSEGWHEVEHDMRYKRLGDWEKHKDMSRFLNGILASIETSEWGILNVLNELSYRHYKDKNIEAMIITKFRLRFKSQVISENIRREINESILKQLFKQNRAEIINCILEHNLIFPMTMDNFIFITNKYKINNSAITELTPQSLTLQFG